MRSKTSDARLINLFLDMLAAEQGAGPNTLDAYRRDLTDFSGFLAHRGGGFATADTERLREFTDSSLPEIEQELKSTAPVYPDFERATFGWSLTKMREVLGADDAMVKRVLGRESPDALVAAVTAFLASPDVSR